MIAPVTPHPDVLAAHLDGETILLHLGSKRYFRLNGTGSLVWRGLEQGQDARAIVDDLVAQYEVSNDEAATEVERLLGEMSKLDLLSTAPRG